MSNNVIKTFKMLNSAEYGWTAENVEKVIEYDKYYGLVPINIPGSCDGCVWMSISKETGKPEPAEFYAERFKGNIIKEYSFEEFERLCS